MADLHRLPAAPGGEPPTSPAAVDSNRRRWPLLLIGASAGTATWSGWVGLGELTGFGVVHPLPGIWDDLTLNTAITLPIGVEAYAVYALAVATDPRPLTRLARRWAWASAGGALLLGMGGQIAYHLLAARDVTTAPVWVVALVSSLPVLVLGAASLLWHLAAVSPVSDATPPVPVSVTVLPVADYTSAAPLTTAAAGVSAEPGNSDRPSAGRRARTAAASTPRPAVTEAAEAPSDEALVAALTALPYGEDLPSIRTVMRAHGIGQARATRAVRAAAARRAAAGEPASLGPQISEMDEPERPASNDETSQERADQPVAKHEIEPDNEPEEEPGKSEEEQREGPDREHQRENQKRKLRAATQEPGAGITPMHHRPSRSLQDH